MSPWSCIDIAADHFSKVIRICENTTGTYFKYKWDKINKKYIG